jgi:hypothetical protein
LLIEVRKDPVGANFSAKRLSVTTWGNAITIQKQTCFFVLILTYTSEKKKKSKTTAPSAFD